MDDQAQESLTRPELQLQSQVKQPPGYTAMEYMAGQQQTAAVAQVPTVEILLKLLSETHQTLLEANDILSNRYNALTGQSANLLNNSVNQIEKQVDASIAGLINQIRNASSRLHSLISKF